MEHLPELPEDDTYTPYLRSFNLHYSVESLLHKASLHQLNAQDLSQQFSVNLEQLEDYHHQYSHEQHAALEQLFISVARWPSFLDSNALTEHINACIESWIEVITNGMPLVEVFNILKCVSLHASTPSQAIKTEWYFLLFDLISETAFTHQTSQVNYLMDHNPVTNLPNTNVLLREMDAHIKTQPSSQLFLMTIRFLIERGAVTISPIMPISLNIKILELLETCLPKPHVTYQCGNMLFSILIEKDISDIQLNLLMARLKGCFEQIINIENQVFLVSPVVGIAANTPHTNGASAYHEARVALSYALIHHQDFASYSPAISDEIEKQKKLELDVTSAFNNEDLELYLQPILGLPEEKCVGAEVLLRWPHAKSLGIYPNVMVEIINKVGLGKMFTRWLVNSVCRLADELITQHHLPIYLTLNLRAEDLYDIELPQLILQSMQFWKIDPKDIILEITENGILEENETTTNIIRKITESGIKLALDDFGTGHSSMARLRTIPISLIKIDQSFVKRINQSNEDFEIVKSMASLAKSLGKDVLVEGIENIECLNLINKIGIKKAQGFYFSKPMPFDEFVLWAKKNTAS
ncbi:MAG: EAL domain-containing protein [Methylophilus sp.]|nr:EAL domain-containing protein [Methylophilus sp.]